MGLSGVMMKILTVTELTLAIKREIEPRFSHVQVEGEVTNIRAQSSGHLYFSLCAECSKGAEGR